MQLLPPAPRIVDQKNWSRCFAWLPTELKDGSWVWLQPIERKWDGSHYDPDYIYRRPKRS